MHTGVVKQRVGIVLGWMIGAIIATAVGLGAVSLLSAGLTSGESTPLSREAVASALASATASQPGRTPTPFTSIPPARSQTISPRTPSAPSSSTPSSSTPSSSIRTPAARPVTRSVTSRGGSAIVECTGAWAYLVSWSPAQGWEVEDQVRGPARSVLVIFDGDNDAVDDLTVTITVTCKAGAPVAAVVTSDD